MNGLPPDLPRLRTLETYLELQLRQVREAIGRLEQPQAPQAEGWVLQHIPSTRDQPINWLHRADCHLAKGARLNRREAALALAEPGVRPCDACHPEQGLSAASA